MVANTRGFSVDIAGMFEDLKPGQGRMLRRKRRLFETGSVRVYVVGCWIRFLALLQWIPAGAFP
ncbi:MAG: hypothetical protein AAF471_02685 [Myxococcota bacterium]